MQSVGVGIETHAELGLEMLKRQLPEFSKAFLCPRGSQTLTRLCGRTHQGRYKEQLTILSTAGKDELKDDGLGTGSVHAVFTDKSPAKCFETYFTELHQIRSSKFATSEDQQHIILLVVGFNQMPGCLLLMNHTHRTCNMNAPLFEVRTRAKKYFQSLNKILLDTKIR